MSTVTVSIGRNVGNVPLTLTEWVRFRDSVREAVKACTDSIFVDDAGTVGEWQGIREDSRTWVAESQSAEFDARLVAWLADIAREYRQDAIAVTTGTTILAGLSVSA